MHVGPWTHASSFLQIKIVIQYVNTMIFNYEHCEQTSLDAPAQMLNSWLDYRLPNAYAQLEMAETAEPPRLLLQPSPNSSMMCSK